MFWITELANHSSHSRTTIRPMRGKMYDALVLRRKGKGKRNARSTHRQDPDGAGRNRTDQSMFARLVGPWRGQACTVPIHGKPWKPSHAL